MADELEHIIPRWVAVKREYESTLAEARATIARLTAERDEAVAKAEQILKDHRESTASIREAYEELASALNKRRESEVAERDRLATTCERNMNLLRDTQDELRALYADHDRLAAESAVMRELCEASRLRAELGEEILKEHPVRRCRFDGERLALHKRQRAALAAYRAMVEKQEPPQ